MAPIATCVLGVGLSGLTFHIPFLLALPDLFSLHSVLERNPKNPGGRVKERFGIDIKIHRSFEDVINDNEIELIIVGTPNETHYNFVKASLNAGKHGTPCGWRFELRVTNLHTDIQFSSRNPSFLPPQKQKN